jgi:hypothetical protein
MTKQTSFFDDDDDDEAEEPQPQRPPHSRPEKRRAARAKRDRALDRVEKATTVAWLAAVTLIGINVARAKRELTTDDIWEVIDKRVEDGFLTPHREPRALGAIMPKLARDGFIEKTNRVQQSIRPQCNARPVAIWISKVYDD